MSNLFRSEDGSLVGPIADEELQALVDCLEEEDSEDTDYYIDRDVIEYLQDRGVSAKLIALLQAALEGRSGVEVYYLKDEGQESHARES